MRGCHSKAFWIGLTLGVLVAPSFGVPLQAGDVNQAPFHFCNDISAVLAKVGCSAAECHGGATGQGGFKLSLFAENPALGIPFGPSQNLPFGKPLTPTLRDSRCILHLATPKFFWRGRIIAFLQAIFIS